MPGDPILEAADSGGMAEDGGPLTAPVVVLAAVVVAAEAEAAVMQERAFAADGAVVTAAEAAVRAHTLVAEALNAADDAETDVEAAVVRDTTGTARSATSPVTPEERRNRQARRALDNATQSAEIAAVGLSPQEFEDSDLIAAHIAAVVAAKNAVSVSDAALHSAALARARSRPPRRTRR
jgi:hypothetical protein